MIWSEQPVRVRAPATSANLGPGFDALGMALELHDEVEAAVTGGGLTIEVSGEGRETAGAGERHLVVRAMREAFGHLGGQPPGIALRCANAIPHGRGLGSSAAAIVSGILAARALAAERSAALPDHGVYRLAAWLEGHPDNVAACLAGGLTIAWTGDGPDLGASAGGAGAGGAGAGGPGTGGPGTGAGSTGAGSTGAGWTGGAEPGAAAAEDGVPPVWLARVPVREGVSAVVCVPGARLATRTARRVLPEQIPHADAAANSGRAALLIAALAADPALLFPATEDFLHQRYRAGVMPETADLIARLRDAGLPAVVSGAGPSVLVFAVNGVDAARAGRAAKIPAGADAEPSAADLVDSIARETGIAWRVIPLDIDRQGAAVQSAGPDECSPEARQGTLWSQTQGIGAPHAEGSP